jgi:uncharacterized protein YjbI with pentapeptide repeats
MSDSDTDTNDSFPMVAEDITGDGYYNDDDNYNSDNEYNEDQQLMNPLTITHNGQQYTISTNLQPADTDLSGFDFSTIVLTPENSIDDRLNLRGANLQGVNLSNCNLENVELPYANLNNANLSNSRLAGASFFQTSLIGTNLSNLQTVSGAYFTGCIINNTTNFNGSNLLGVDFADWVSQVQNNGLELTEEQMLQLNDTYNVMRDDDLFDFIENNAVRQGQSRQQQMESMRQATANLQSRGEQLASELDEKPDRGYGECSLCLEGFQPGEVVIDVHPEQNNYHGSTHKFHKDCIIPICNNRNPKCPICRGNINCENIKKAGTGPEVEGTGEVIMNKLQGGKRSRSKNSKKGKKLVTKKRKGKKKYTNKKRKVNKKRRATKRK